MERSLEPCNALKSQNDAPAGVGLDDESCTEEGAECLDGSCVVPTCEDGLQNGEETDIDCGGPDCEACEPGKMCELTEDCQPPVELPWSDCDFGESTCAEVGTRERLVTRYVCGDQMTCEIVEEVETESCTRETDALECGETVIGEWGACQGAGEQGVCSTEGRRRRVITSFVCADGGCEVVEEDEFEACVLDTDAQACGTPETGVWSECGGFDSVCDQEGTRSRTVTYFECNGGDCNERVDTETETCRRSTGGDSCGDTTYGDWSACEGFSGVCGQTGTQFRTVTYRECAGGACDTRSTTESQQCTRDTNGVECQPDVEGTYSACSYEDETCSNSGSRTRLVTEYACQGGACTPSTRTETDTEGCARNRDGTTCDQGTTHTNWSSCSIASGACSGTQTRTRTERTCSGGTCISNHFTEEQSCNQTNGTTCGAGTTRTNYSACNLATNACSGTKTRTRTDRTCNNGTCVSTDTPESQSCNASNGTTCGTTSTGTWGACLLVQGTCGGEQRQPVTYRRCSNGSCTNINTTNTRGCTAPSGTNCNCNMLSGTCTSGGVCDCSGSCFEGSSCTGPSGQWGCCSGGICREGFLCP